jgi:hypothetical protein
MDIIPEIENAIIFLIKIWFSLKNELLAAVTKYTGYIQVNTIIP